MYFSKKEQSIIKKFYSNINDLTNRELVLLVWDSGTIYANFDTCFDDTDIDGEDCTSFIFKQIDKTGTPPISVNNGEFFTLNYLNFPKHIYLNEQEIG